MDRPLESDRHRDGGGYNRDNRGDNRGHYGGGGGGGYRGGRGRGRRGGGGFRGRGRGRGRGRHGGHRNHHHNNRNNNHEWEDPNARLIKQLSVMISRVGEYKAPDPPMEGDNPTETDEDNNGIRPVVQAIAKNISDLTVVVSKATNVATFLKFIPPPPPKKPEEMASGFGFTRPPPKPEDQAGPMAHLIVSCAATLPLQTPCYAALTVSVNAYSKSHVDYAGFAGRCVTYTLQRLSYDMDTLFVSTAPSTADLRPKIACRIKLMLRYLAMLGRLQVIQAHDNSNAEEVPAEEEDDTTKSYSLMGFLQRLVETALAAAPTEDAFAPTSSSNAAAPLILVYFILSTIPYIASFVPIDMIQEQLLDPLQTLLGSYASSFTPGVGMTAILLKEEQLEGNDDDDEEEDDDDDDDDEEEASEVVCDSLQDLYRSVQLFLKEYDPEKQPSRFTLLTDEPWKAIPGPPPAAEPAAETAMDTEGTGETDPAAAPPVAEPAEAGPLVHSDPALRLKIPSEAFKSLALLSNPNASELEEEAGIASATPSGPPSKIQAFPLELVVFGRLPFFGSPQQPQDGGEDEEDMEDEDAPANEQVAAYMKQFGILDRCFLADAIRDLLCCHESNVSATGLERGSAKSVAEQVWSLGHVFATSNSETDASSSGVPTGVEYGIVEALLSLILQNSSNSTFRQIYLSRVLLELTRLQPSLVSPALALAASNLFQDYTPAMVPAARHNLSCWLAFHLVNTDYQWPTAYWTHWQSYLGDDKSPNSRGIVVKTMLHYLMENVHNPAILVKDCLPNECQVLVNQIVCPLPISETNNEGETSIIDVTEKDIRRRVWDDDEHPETLKNYLIGDELSEALAGDAVVIGSSPKGMWCRCGILLRALLQPLEREHQRLLTCVEQGQKSTIKAEGEEEDDQMEDDDELSEDTLAVVQEVLLRHGPTLAGAIQKDKEVLQASQGTENDGNHLTACEPYLLSILYSKGCFSRSIMEACMVCLLQQSEILSCLGVLRWALGDLAGVDQTLPVERWWEFAMDAIHRELRKSRDAVAPEEANGGMVIDRTGENGALEPDAPQDANPAGSKTLATIESISPLLDYIVRRACTLLSEQPEDPRQGKKLKPQQVDLVEGVKSCVRAAHGLLLSELRKSNENEKGVSEREIKDCLSQSSVTGWKLSGVCQEFHGGHAVNVLRECLATV